MTRFENADFVVEFPGILEVEVTEKSTGKVYIGNGKCATDMKYACKSLDDGDTIRKTFQYIWKWPDVDERYR